MVHYNRQINSISNISGYHLDGLRSNVHIFHVFINGQIVKIVFLLYTWTHFASYLDIHIEINSVHKLRTKLYDKTDHFIFPDVNFQLILCSLIPAAPAYGVYLSQLIRYCRCCGSYHDILDRVLLLFRKLLKQGFIVVNLKSLRRKVCGRHHDLLNRHGVSVSQMTTNMFCLS